MTRLATRALPVVNCVTRVIRALAVSVAVLICGGIPSSSALRRVVVHWTAPPLPRDGAPRDAVVLVAARGPGEAPVAGARVSVLALRAGDEGARAYAAGDATTDRAGHARIERVPRGEAWVTVEAEGLARASTNVVLDAGERTLEVSLGIAHRLDVEVKDERGAPVAGAEVEVVEADPLPIGARAGADGMAHVSRLGEPPWAVTARKEGFDEVTTRGVRDGAPLRVVLHRLGAIVARVVDERGEGVARARVKIASPALWPARVADADDAGSVRIAALPSGTYALRAVAGERASAIELGVDLARGEQKSVMLRLVPSERVDVRVVGDDAAPVEGAKLTLAESGLSPFPVEAVTDKEGRARLGPIARGPASLVARAEGYVARETAVPDPLAGELLVTLARAGVIEGRVVDARGFPVDGATIEIVGTGFDGAPIDDEPRRARFTDAQFTSALAGPRPLVASGELGVMPGPVPKIPAAGATIAGAPPSADAPDEPWVTRADGTYRASPASPGRVRALVHHPQYVDASSDLVTLAPGGRAVLDVVMRAGGAIEGRVVDSRGQGVEGARVVLAAAHGTLERAARTASDGTFGFAAVPVDVVLLVSPDDEGSAVEARAQVSVPEGGRRSVTIELPAAREPLPVTVKDDRGYPVEGAQVSVVSLDPASGLRETVFTDARGEATLARAKGLALRVEASAPGHAPVVQRLDASAAQIDLALAPAETATGEVRSTRGEPLVDAEVALYTELGARRARTSEDGSFRIGELAAGPAKLIVRAPGFARAARDAVLGSSDGRHATDLGRIELTPGGAVEGVVLDARGDPLAGARVADGLVPTYLAAGASPTGVAVTDGRGRFRLTDLAEGDRTLEAYAPDVGRARVDVRVAAGETTRDVRISLVADGGGHAREVAAAGSVAVTLGERGDPPEVVVASVAEGSEAEHAGLAPGDVVVDVQGEAATTMEQARAKMNGPLGEDVLVTVRRAGKTEALRVAREAVRR